VLSTKELQDHAEHLERLVAQRTRELERANAELRDSLMHDGLTRIANRMAFQEHLERCCGRPSQGAGELALLMVDVDMFKAFNDHYGHLRGDETLRIVASCLERAVREPEDLACRYGGEEFAVVLPGTGIRGATAVAKRFRELLAEAAVPHAASSVAPVVTASVGIAVTRAGMNSDHDGVIGAADHALYRAKNLGRDRIVIASSGDAAIPQASRRRISSATTT
jgi:diguanylate cyclase (GGDEF)-like protein